MIRQIGPEDLDVFKQIRLEALRAEPAAFASSPEDWECLSDEDWERRLTVNPVFVAFDNGQLVGIVGLMRQSPSKMAHRASVIMVYVRKNLRGSGIATSLLMALTDHAQSEGIRQLELTVSCETRQHAAFIDAPDTTKLAASQIELSIAVGKLTKSSWRRH